MQLLTIVQTCPQRREALPVMLEHLRASDVGDDFEVMEHPPGMTLYDFFLSVMRRLIDSGADYGIRLEDDFCAGKHFLHNTTAWPALHDSDMGAGWLFAPEGVYRNRAWLRWSPLTREPYRNSRELHASLAVLFPIPFLREELYARLQGEPRPQDLAISGGVWETGRKCYIHYPALGENLMFESTRGHDHNRYHHCANSFHQPEFRR